MDCADTVTMHSGCYSDMHVLLLTARRIGWTSVYPIYPPVITGEKNRIFIVTACIEFFISQCHAGQYMEGHNECIKHGVDDNELLMAGIHQPDSGGGFVAHNTTL